MIYLHSWCLCFNCVLTCLFGGTESCHTYGMYCQGCQKHKVEDKIGEENEAANTSPLFIDEACHQWVLQEIGAIRFHLKMCSYEECVHSMCAFIVQLLHNHPSSAIYNTSNCNCKCDNYNNSNNYNTTATTAPAATTLATTTTITTNITYYKV